MYVLSLLHALYLCVCFVNISVFILTEIPTGLSNSFYTNNFIFVGVNVDIENAMHSDLVKCNNFINYKVLPTFNFHFINLESSQLLQTDTTPKRKCINYYCFSLVLFILPIKFARVFLKNKHKRAKAFFGCIMFLLSITKPNLLTKNDILKSTSKSFTYESIDTSNVLQASHFHNAFAIFALSKYRNTDCFFKLLLLLSGNISLNSGPSRMNQT